MNLLNLRPASIQLMKNLVKYIFLAQRNDSFLSMDKLALIMDKSIKSIKNGIFMLNKLKIIDIDNSNQLMNVIFNKLNSNYSIDKLILDRILIYPLFCEYLFLLRGRLSDLEAAIFLKYNFNLNISEKVIKSTFNGWIKYYDIKLEPELNNDLIILRESIKDESAAILYIRENFNDNLSRVPETVIMDLMEGVINANDHPDNSLTDTGRALENYLRLRYGQLIGLKDSNGIIQISNKLRKNRLISNKHNNIINALGSIRSIGDAHGIDKEEEKTWEVSRDSALLFNSLTIKIIRSIENYINGNLLF